MAASSVKWLYPMNMFEEARIQVKWLWKIFKDELKIIWVSFSTFFLLSYVEHKKKKIHFFTINIG